MMIQRFDHKLPQHSCKLQQVGHKWSNYPGSLVCHHNKDIAERCTQVTEVSIHSLCPADGHASKRQVGLVTEQEGATRRGLDLALQHQLVHRTVLQQVHHEDSAKDNHVTMGSPVSGLGKIHEVS